MSKIFPKVPNSGVTGAQVRETTDKNVDRKSKVNPAMTARGITENGKIKNGDAQMGSSLPAYNPSPAPCPAYNGRPKR